MYGASKQSAQTLIYKKIEYWKKRSSPNGRTYWRCSKYRSLSCHGTVVTDGLRVFSNLSPEHTHEGKVATSLARKAVAGMKAKMVETIATPSSSQGAIAATLDDHVLMALPKKTTLCRLLRRHRKWHVNAGTGNALPPTPIDLFSNFRNILKTSYCSILNPATIASLY